MAFREQIVLGGHGLPSGVTSASQVKIMGAGAFTEAVPRLAPKAPTNGFTQAQASDGHVQAGSQPRTVACSPWGKAEMQTSVVCAVLCCQCQGYDTHRWI